MPDLRSQENVRRPPVPRTWRLVRFSKEAAVALSAQSRVGVAGKF